MSFIEKAELKKRLENPDFLLLDVRTHEEYRDGFIPTAKNIPVQEFDNFKLDDKAFNQTYSFPKPKVDDEIIVYCKMGGRAMSAAQILESIGYNHMVVYKGSWMDWISD